MSPGILLPKQGLKRKKNKQEWLKSSHGNGTLKTTQKRICKVKGVSFSRERKPERMNKGRKEGKKHSKIRENNVSAGGRRTVKKKKKSHGEK